MPKRLLQNRGTTITLHPKSSSTNGFSGLRKAVEEMRRSISLQDIVSTQLHSRDFNASRARYIAIRIRLLAFIFAVLAPLWIPVDSQILDSETFRDMVLLRLLLAACFLLLSRWGGHTESLYAAYFRLFSFITVSGLFFLASNSLLPDTSNIEHSILLGYSFLPFLVMTVLAVAPLTFIESASVAGLIIGFFIVTRLVNRDLLNIHNLGDLWLLLLLAIIAIWVQIAQLQMLLRLYREATRDALTGLANRRILAAKLEQEITLSRQHGSPLSLLLFDLDLFKCINDTYGHHAGDRVLLAFADILRNHCRDMDLVGRFGGEEFLAILPDTSLEEAQSIAEKIRIACYDTPVYDTINEHDIRFTTSTGVALCRSGEHAQQLLARVDESLYRAKTSGRDLVFIAE